MGRSGSVSTTPKLICLPMGSGKLHRNSFRCQKGPGTDSRHAGRRPARRALALGGRHRKRQPPPAGGDSDQARLASPSALSTSTDAMIRRAGQGEEGAKQTETCTGKPFTSFASFAKGGLAGAMYSFKCHTHPAISPSHAKKPPQRHHDARRPH